MACDRIKQDLLQKAENAGILNLDGSDDDDSREVMVEKIMKIISKDSHTKTIE